MEKTFLIKIGEIALKAGNRKAFERQLERNILQKFNSDTRYFGNNGRYFLVTEGYPEKEIKKILSSTFGITGFGPVVRCEKELPVIEREVLNLTGRILEENPGAAAFKIEPRRSDKGFPLSSYELACTLGDAVLSKYPNLSVDCNNPDFTLHCEIRDRTLLFGDTFPGPGGLPVGCAGKGTLLLSGGIDSPIAGYLMAKRGLKLNAVYFHTPPFTSDKTREKVETLVRVLTPYCSGLGLFTVPFTDVQLHIKQNGREKEITLLMRASMMRIAEIIAGKNGSKCLVTGEALSQVASQTVESLTFTGSYPDMPVFRPLIGYDKEEIIDLARKIGTFDISILPYDDCCTVFSPSRPVVRPRFDLLRDAYDKLQIDDLLQEAVENAEYGEF